MISRAREPSAGGAFIVVIAAVVALCLVVLLFPMDAGTWDLWGAALVGPALFFAAIPALVRQARREGDSKIYRFLVLALTAKMVVSLWRYYHGFYIVDGADARGYDAIGTEIATRFLGGDFHSGLPNVLDSNWIRFFTGVVYTVIRPSVIAGYLFYAWLAFWGTFFFYRAFVLAVPHGDRRAYGRLLFFMPSILFWPSSIGKESWMMFGLGIAAFGAAKMLRSSLLPGVLIAGIGIGLSALVRAPIAGVFGLGIVAGGLLRRQPGKPRQLAPLARLASVALFVVGGLVLIGVMQRYFVRATTGGNDLDTLVSESLRLTGTGDSEFTPPSTGTPAGVMLAAATVLFRPFIYEAHTPEAIVTAIESSVLLVFSVSRLRWLLSAVTAFRRTPLVAISMVYLAGSVFALSSVANFGIIARQRTLLYPMFLILLCIPPRRQESGRRNLYQRGEDGFALLGAPPRGGPHDRR